MAASQIHLRRLREHQYLPHRSLEQIVDADLILEVQRATLPGPLAVVARQLDGVGQLLMIV
jgi:hypothetical protein